MEIIAAFLFFFLKCFFQKSCEIFNTLVEEVLKNEEKGFDLILLLKLVLRSSFVEFFR